MNNMRVEYMKTHSKDLIKLIEQEDLLEIPDADKIDLIKDLQNFEDLSLGDKIVMPEEDEEEAEPA